MKQIKFIIIQEFHYKLKIISIKKIKIYNGIWPVGPRDFVEVTLTKKFLDEKTIRVVATSCTLDSEPETKKATRGCIHIGGWEFH